MKVALISHSFPPHMTGGIGSYTLNLAEALTKKGIDVTVFCGGKVKKELDVNFKIKRLPMWNFPPRAVWFQLQNYSFFKKELKKFDIIHGQNTASTFYSPIKKEVGKPWAVTFHDCLNKELNIFLESPLYTKNLGDFIFNVIEYPIYKKLYDLDLKYSDKIVSVGYSVLDDLMKAHKFDSKKVITIQNGVDIGRIDKIVKTLPKKKSNKKTRLIFFGRLFYRKGPTFLIEAMKGVIKENQNVILDIYGEGPLKKVLEKQIEECGLKQYVNLHKFIPNKEVIREICNSDIVILPSLYEAFPITYLEVMACSKPLITFDYPFAREIIKNNEDGILVKPKDSKALREAILKLIGDKSLRERLGREAYKKVKERFNLKDQASKYLKLYRELIENATKSKKKN